MYLVCIIIPLSNYLLLFFFGRYLFQRFIYHFILCTLCTSRILSLFIPNEVIVLNQTTELYISPWLDLLYLKINWSLLFDPITSIMLFLVLSISLLVHLYAPEYMRKDPCCNKFLSYLSLFTFSMLLFITASNYIQMFMCWECIGLSPYLPINSWYSRISASQASMKASITNRIGDFGFYFSFILVYITFNTFDYYVIFALTPYVKNFYITIVSYNILILDSICFFLLLGAIGKSAQIGLHTWLPDAMEGPTPVSASIHAATMVTAGIFSIIRSSFPFEYSSNISILIMWLGAITTFMSGTIGCLQNDMKKIIAYPTCSQSGYMLVSCGSSDYVGSLYHLLNHAFFKALLFLGAGSVIHSYINEQDIRRYGMNHRVLPLSHACLLIGSGALSGLPFMAGFYSKDRIIEATYSVHSYWPTVLYSMLTVSIIFTCIYTVRLIWYTFVIHSNGSKYIQCNANDFSEEIKFVILVLTYFSIFIGYCCKDIFLGLGINVWSCCIGHEKFTQEDIEFITALPKDVTPVSIGLGSLLFYSIFLVLPYIKYLDIYKRFSIFLNKKWLFDSFYNHFIVRYTVTYAYDFSFKVIDRGFLEKALSIYGYISWGDFLAKPKGLQRGYIFVHIFLILAFVIISNIIRYTLLFNMDLYIVVFLMVMIILLSVSR